MRTPKPPCRPRVSLLGVRHLVLAMVGLSLAILPAVAMDDAPPPVPAAERPEVLTSGPVNEAFAQPVNLEDQGGVLAPSQPPPPIAEVPPIERPAGDQFTWMPGYWSWDTGRNNWIWVSACWRATPPGMVWVPGYWYQVAGGWQWVPGFWTLATSRELEYLPMPPPPPECDAPVGPPGPDATWVPGCWYWQQGRWVIRHGYWLRQYSGWVWSPSHVRWSPRGYVFCSGHWDRTLERRGVLFAPVCLPRYDYRGGWRYEPSITINISVLLTHLFVAPRYNHYYVGNYYDHGCERRGIFPRSQTESLRKSYDALYVHELWSHRDHLATWRDKERQTVQLLRANVDLRPAHTYREQEARVAKLPPAQRPTVTIARPLSVEVRAPSPFRFERADLEAQRASERQAAAQQTYRLERQHWEVGARPSAPPAGPAGRDPRPSGWPSPGDDHRWTGGQPRPVERTDAVKVTIPLPPSPAARPEPAAPPRPPAEPGAASRPPRAPAPDAKHGDGPRPDRGRGR